MALAASRLIEACGNQICPLCVMKVVSQSKAVYKHVNEAEKRESTRLIMFLTD